MPSPFEIRDARPDDREAWDDFQRRNGGTVYHEWTWGEIAARATGDAWSRILAVSDGAIVGATCCLERRRLGMRFGLAPLLTPYIGPTLGGQSDGENLEIRRALLEAMRRWFRLIHIQASDDADAYDGIDHWRAGPRRTLIVDLDRPEEELWDRLKSSAKRQIKKARENVEIVFFDSARIYEEGASESNAAPTWGEVDRLTRLTFEKRGEVCPIAPELIRGLMESPELSGRRRIISARDSEGELISVIVALIDRPEGSTRPRTAYYTHAATHPDALATGVSSLLVWEALARLAKNGAGDDAEAPPAVQFDFCGGNIPSIAKFKDGFAPRERLYADLQTARPMTLLKWRERWQVRRRTQRD